MKSITIHNLDDTLEALIRAKAKKNGLSLNKTIQLLLRQSLGLSAQASNDYKSDFQELCGVWSAADETAFNAQVQDLNEVNPDDWR